MKKNYLILVPLLLCHPVLGQSSKEIRYKSRDLEKVKAEISQKKEERLRLEREADELTQSIKESASKIRNVETSLVYTKQRNREVEQQVAVAKNQHDKLAASASEKKAHIRNTFKTYYVASLLTTPDSHAALYTRQLLHGQASQLKRAQGKRDETGQDLRSLIDAQQVIRGEVKKQENRLSSIRDQVEDKERLITKKKTRQEILESEMRELRQTAEELASLIDVLRTKEKEEAQAEKDARRAKQVSGQSPIVRHSLPWPVTGKVVMKFGRQQNASGATFVSNGIVIAPSETEPVLAVGDGKVLYAGEFMSYGNMAVIEHPGDWYTVYGRLLKWEVEKGQALKKGDRVGMSRPKPGGGTEAYFELRFYGKSTDPMPWLAR